MTRTAMLMPLAALTLTSALAVGTADATVFFDSLSITTKSAVSATRGATTNSDSDTTIATLASLPSDASLSGTASTASVRVGAATPIQSNASTTAIAYFSDAGNGTFDASSDASIVQRAASTVANPLSGAASAGSYSISYGFSVDTISNFLLNYELFDPNFVAGHTVTAKLTGPSGGFSSSIAPNAAGSLASLLGVGSYTLDIFTDYQSHVMRSAPANGVSTGISFDHFALTIASYVPEPATWAMMVLGFGVIGAGMRRRMSAYRPFAIA